MFPHIKLRSCVVAFLSSAFLAFGLYNVHSISGVTEGGILGITLLLHHWFDISPALSGFVMNLACYILGSKLLGKVFIAYSIVSSMGFSLAYKIFEQFDPLWPQLAEMPLLAAVLGALFIGIGSGLCVRIGGAPGGDDALAMSINHISHIKIQWIYLIMDIIVLAMSLSYIPIQRVAYSLLTVVLSGQIIGLIQRLRNPFVTAAREEINGYG